MIATYATPAGVAEAVRLVRAGAERAGRDPAQLRLMSRVDTCVHADAARAFDGTRGMIARFLWTSFPDRNFVRRAGLEVPGEVETLIARRDYALVPQAAALIPDEFVRAFTWAGTPEMIVERVTQIARQAGVREFGFWLLLAPGQTREEALRLLGEAVSPRLRAGLAAALTQ
jgi:5,10-methylenetetrahydromethanopterin reductase